MKPYPGSWHIVLQLSNPVLSPIPARQVHILELLLEHDDRHSRNQNHHSYQSSNEQSKHHISLPISQRPSPYRLLRFHRNRRVLQSDPQVYTARKQTYPTCELSQVIFFWPLINLKVSSPG